MSRHRPIGSIAPTFAPRSVIDRGGIGPSAAQVFADLLAETIWNGLVDGNERWRTFGGVTVGGRFMVVVVVHTYPDPDDETRVHASGLREANCR